MKRRAIAWIGTLLCAVVLDAATHVVDVSGGTTYQDIQSAIEAASEGDTVSVRPGEYGTLEPISFRGKAIAVRSTGGQEVTTIRYTGESDAAIEFSSGETSASSFEGFTVTGGRRSGMRFVASSPAIADCTIQGNVGYEGGGIFCQNASPVFSRCRVTANATGDGGGGACCFGGSSPRFTECTFSGNYACGDLGAGEGGGVFSYQSFVTLTSCTITGNAAWGGAGLYCSRGATTLVNCVIASNCCFYEMEAASLDHGGGIACSGPVTLKNCTIAGNCASVAGGVYCAEQNPSTQLVLTNCILWNNLPDSLCGVISHCLSLDDPLFLSNGVSDFERWKPLDIPFGNTARVPDFIVEPPDYRLRQGSPAIDAGTLEGAPAFDIEGDGRPCGAGVDMGAYEMGACPADTHRFHRGDTNTDNTIDIADAIFTLGYLFGSGPVPSCLDAADGNDDGAVNIADAIAVLSHLFAGAGDLPEPFGECGVDPTVDELGCSSFPPCE